MFSIYLPLILETLHQIFIDLTLKAEQEEYMKEGIPWEQVKYHNNKPTVDFLDGVHLPHSFVLYLAFLVFCAYFVTQKPLGLFTVLDEEVLMPKGTDATFVDKLNISFARNPIYKQAASRDSPISFAVQHYLLNLQNK